MNRVLGACIVALACVAVAQASVIVTFQDQTPTGNDPGVIDAGLQKSTTESPTNGDNNYGLTAKQRLYCDTGDFQNPDRYGPRHAIFKFDVSSLESVSAEITSAKFRMYVHPNRSTKPGAWYHDMTLSRVLPGKDWVEGTADGAPALPGEVTWNSQKHLMTAWDTPGATGATDVDTTTAKTFDIPHTVVLGELKMIEVDVTDFVQAWASGTENNGMVVAGGWIDDIDIWMNNLNAWHVVMSENVGGTGMFDGAGNPVTIGTCHRPALIVDVPEPASLSLLALGAVVMIRRRK